MSGKKIIVVTSPRYNPGQRVCGVTARLFRDTGTRLIFDILPRDDEPVTIPLSGDEEEETVPIIPGRSLAPQNPSVTVSTSQPTPEDPQAGPSIQDPYVPLVPLAVVSESNEDSLCGNGGILKSGNEFEQERDVDGDDDAAPLRKQLESALKELKGEKDKNKESEVKRKEYEARIIELVNAISYQNQKIHELKCTSTLYYNRNLSLVGDKEALEIEKVLLMRENKQLLEKQRKESTGRGRKAIKRPLENEKVAPPRRFPRGVGAKAKEDDQEASDKTATVIPPNPSNDKVNDGMVLETNDGTSKLPIHHQQQREEEDVSHNLYQCQVKLEDCRKTLKAQRRMNNELRRNKMRKVREKGQEGSSNPTGH